MGKTGRPPRFERRTVAVRRGGRRLWFDPADIGIGSGCGVAGTGRRNDRLDVVRPVGLSRTLGRNRGPPWAGVFAVPSATGFSYRSEFRTRRRSARRRRRSRRPPVAISARLTVGPVSGPRLRTSDDVDSGPVVGHPRAGDVSLRVTAVARPVRTPPLVAEFALPSGTAVPTVAVHEQPSGPQ